jgi:hypothetical protein
MRRLEKGMPMLGRILSLNFPSFPSLNNTAGAEIDDPGGDYGVDSDWPG